MKTPGWRGGEENHLCRRQGAEILPGRASGKKLWLPGPATPAGPPRRLREVGEVPRQRRKPPAKRCRHRDAGGSQPRGGACVPMSRAPRCICRLGLALPRPGHRSGPRSPAPGSRGGGHLSEHRPASLSARLRLCFHPDRKPLGRGVLRLPLSPGRCPHARCPHAVRPDVRPEGTQRPDRHGGGASSAPAPGEGPLQSQWRDPGAPLGPGA